MGLNTTPYDKIEESSMTAIIPIYDHIIDRYMTQSQQNPWNTRLADYRKWMQENDKYTWPMTDSIEENFSKWAK